MTVTMFLALTAVVLGALSVTMAMIVQIRIATIVKKLDVASNLIDDALKLVKKMSSKNDTSVNN